MVEDRIAEAPGVMNPPERKGRRRLRWILIALGLVIAVGGTIGARLVFAERLAPLPSIGSSGSTPQFMIVLGAHYLPLVTLYGMLYTRAGWFLSRCGPIVPSTTLRARPEMNTRPKETVGDYPRPPAVERVDRHVRALVSGHLIAETRRAIRVLETHHPPVYYIPPEDVATEFLVPSEHRSFCEFKGEARYYSLVVDGVTRSNVAWYYPHPSAGYEELANHVAFYAWALDEATVDGEQVTPQPGHFYGGWITSEIEGPIKGAPGTTGW